MKRMLYITTSQVRKDARGIEYKIYKQIELFKECGYDVTVYNDFIDERFIIRLLYLLPLFNCKYKYDRVKEEKNINLVYIRYYLCDNSLIEMLKTIRLKNPNVKIIVEIPTYPYDSEISKYASKLYKDKCHRKQLKSMVDRIITFSDDNVIYGIPTINISNAVDMERIKINHFKEPRDNAIHLVGVAQFDFWHGYDRVIEGMHRYYENGGTQRFVFHIVGFAKQKKILDDYKKMVSDYKLDDYVIFHGKQYGEELDNIYSVCSLSVDSLGRHRSKVYYNSSLKGKEYMAKGLPIISGVNTEMDRVEGYPYYYRVPADDSPIDFFAVEDYFHRVYDNRTHDQVSEEMRAFCEKHFSFMRAYKPLLDYIND